MRRVGRMERKTRFERARMTDATLVAVVLAIGGAIFLTTFLWITVQRLKEIGPPKPPPDHH